MDSNGSNYSKLMEIKPIVRERQCGESFGPSEETKIVVSKDLIMEFNLASGCFRYSSTQSSNNAPIGVFMKQGCIIIDSGSELIYGYDTRREKETEGPLDIGRGDKRYIVHYKAVQPGIPKYFDIIFNVLGSLNEIIITVDLKGQAGYAAVQGRMEMGPEPYAGNIGEEAVKDVFSVSFGPVSSVNTKTLFNRFNDSAVSLSASSPDTRLVHILGTPEDEYYFYSLIRTDDANGKDGNVPYCRMKIYPDFYINNLNCPVYSTLDKSVNPKAPCGWLSWYGYVTNETEEIISQAADWLDENLSLYAAPGEQLYLVIDAGWSRFHMDTDSNGAAILIGRDPLDVDANKYAGGMAKLAEYIHSKGLKAGVWLMQHGPGQRVYGEYPEIFIRDAEGNPVSNSRDWLGIYILDGSNKAGVYEYLLRVFKAMDEWGYDYYKLDGQPDAVISYNGLKDYFSNTEVSVLDAFRNTISPIRDAVGNKDWIAGCMGPVKEGIGIFNSCRIGCDNGHGLNYNWYTMKELAVSEIEQFNYLHNVVWYNDPDCLLIQNPITLEECRSLATAYALTGVQLMLGDRLAEIPLEKLEIVKRAFAPADMKPMDFKEYSQYNFSSLWDLKVEKSFKTHDFNTWDVLGVFNWSDDFLENKAINPADLGLDKAKTYIVYDFWNQKLIGEVTGSFEIKNLDPHSCRLFSIHSKYGKPQVVSTSRHITQGAVDLLENHWDDETVTLRGTSHITGKDPYIISIYIPQGYKLTGKNEVVVSGVDTKVSIVENNNITGLLKIKIERTENGIAGWSVKFGKFPTRSRKTPEQIPVPANLAAGKKASASGVSAEGFEASQAADGKNNTRWTGAAWSEEEKAWLEIDFGKPVTFNKTIITQYEDCIEQYRIEYYDGVSWKNAYSYMIPDAGSELFFNGYPVLNNGLGIKPKYDTFPAVTASKVRLFIVSMRKDTSKTASICEFEVYDTIERK